MSQVERNRFSFYTLSPNASDMRAYRRSVSGFEALDLFREF